MLNRLRGEKPAPAPPSIDAPRVVKYMGDPVVEHWTKKALAGEWQDLEVFLGDLRDIRLRDYYISEICNEIEGRPKWIDGWVAKRPGAWLPLMFRGEHSVCWAWQARGSGWAKDVPKDAFKLFFHRLGLARQDLETATRMCPPDDPGPLVPQIHMGMGLNYRKPEIMQIWYDIQDRLPWHGWAVGSMIQALAPKWGGSLAAMMDFAHATAAAPAGSGAHIGLVKAHFEVVRESDDEGNTEDYWLQPSVREDVIAAAERFNAPAASNATPCPLSDHGWLLYASAAIEEWDLFARELEIVQGRLVGAPWTWNNNPVRFYQWALDMMRAEKGTRLHPLLHQDPSWRRRRG
jgi:hypothetical protein